MRSFLVLLLYCNLLFTVSFLLVYFHEVCICLLMHFSLLWGFQLIVPPVLNSFGDQDSRVRYYACEALYNIAKVGN